jgi:DNA repair exonuclease SbcCD ATPase subunit
MNTSWMSPKIIAGIATALLIVSLIGFMNMYTVNTSLQGNLKDQKLRSESLLSEKLLLEKDIEKFRNDLNSLKGSNAALDKALASAAANLSAKESEYKKLQQQNSSLKNYKKQHDALVTMRRELQETIDGLTGSLVRLQMENKDLSGTIANLEKRNIYLQQELNKAMIASLDQPRIETVKGRKERLTVVARKTSKMKVNVDIPADLKEVSFRIKDSAGKVLSTDEGTIASRVIEDFSTLAASGENSMELAKPTKRIEMVYNANRKLQPGIYTVEILSENHYVGSMQVKLK